MMFVAWLASKTGEQKGAVAVTVAVLLIVLIGFAALSIDIGYLMVTRNELQNVADAAALAATRKLGNNYENMTNEQQAGYTCGTAAEWDWPCSDITSVAIEAGLANRAGQVDIVINENDVFIGRWDFTLPQPFDPANDPFTAQDANPIAVRVIARRDAQANTPITTFLAGVLDVETLAVSAVATGSLSAQGSAVEGELQLPVGIDGKFFENPAFCKEDIYFSPTNLSCSGWTSWEDKTNTPKMRRLISGEDSSPAMESGEDIFQYGGGEMANLFDDLLLLFMREGHDVHDVDDTPVATTTDGMHAITGALPNTPPAEPLLDADGNPVYYPQESNGQPDYSLPARNRHLWETTVVVYESSECGNPNQEAMTVGFATVKITDVIAEPEKTIKGSVVCGSFSNEPTRGGGGAFGTFGTIPGLVQ
jgi:Flp pilus assembly protein TadG